MRTVQVLILSVAAPAAVAALIVGCAGETGNERSSSAPTSASPILLSMDGVGGSADLWLVNPDGRNLRNLTETEDEYAPSWSPDGKRIVFVRQYHSGEDIGGDDLFLLDVADGREEPLLVTEAEEEYPVWSPDGSRIAFVSDHEAVLGAIYTIRPDGTGLEFVGARGRMPESLTWSPDGDRIAFVTNVGPGDDLRVHILDLESGQATPVSGGEIDQEPVWSPRADEILFGVRGTCRQRRNGCRARDRGRGAPRELV